MDKRTNKIIKQYVKAVADTYPGFVTAYSFGSFNTPRQTEDSDIDIALIINSLEDSKRFDLQVQLMILALKYDNRIEPHPISKSEFNASNPFFAQILNTGKEIQI